LTLRRAFAQHELVRRAGHSSSFLLLSLVIISIASVSTRAGTIHLSAAGPSPTLLNVLTNEPVIFIADDAGSYAVVSFNWAAGTIDLPQQGSTGSVTLRFSGLYNYEDGQGGNGIIYVNIPPTYQITNPTNNAVFTAPASFDFTVDARNTDEDKSVFIDGNFQFSATGVTPGSSIVLQSSTHLTFPGNWMALRTNVASGSSIFFTNPTTAGASFFRVVQLP
jgi:hypothetical protein